MTEAPSASPRAPLDRPIAPPEKHPGAPDISAAPAPGLTREVRWALAAGLAIVGTLVYLPALTADFVYDDAVLVKGNRNVASLGAAWRAFFEPLWSFQNPTSGFENAFWRPLTVLVIALGRTLSGPDPWGHHALSLVLHLLASLAAWRLASRLLSSPGLGFAAALIFALHPVHVESVAWISAVNDPLYGLFALLALDAHLAWRGRGSRGAPVAAGAWLLLALLCKEQALAVIPIALVMDLAFGHLRSRAGEADDDPFADLLRTYGPFLAAVALYYAGRVVAYGSLLAGFDQASARFGHGLARAWQFRVEISGRFLELLTVPFDQAIFRQVRPEIPAGHAPWLRAMAFALAWLVATVAAARARRRLALALLLAVPASFSVILIRYEGAGGFPISDRYLYVPVIFVAVLAATVLRRLLPSRAVGALLALAALVGGMRTYRYAGRFHDDESFFRAAVAAEPDNSYARQGLGRVLMDKYHLTLDREALDEAAFQFLMSQKIGYVYGERGPKLGAQASFAERASELNRIITNTPPSTLQIDQTVMVSMHDRLQANLGLGWCTLFRALDPRTAERDFDWPKVIFEQVLKRATEDPRLAAMGAEVYAHTGLGTTLIHMDRLQEAEASLRKAVQLNPSYAEAWRNLGLCLTRQERWDEARAAYEQALRFRPDDLQLLLEIAGTAADGKRFEIAERRLDEAQGLYPDSVEPVFLRGMVAAKRGDFTTALARFDQVLARLPDHPEAHLNRGKVLAQSGEIEGAVQELGIACELLPESFDAHYQMARLLLATPGAERSALRYLTPAYRLSRPDPLRRVLHEQLARLVGGDREQLLTLALMSEARGDYVHALDWTERMLAVAQADPSASAEELAFLSYKRGTFLAGLKRHVQALEAHRECLAAVPDHLGANHDAAQILAIDLGRAAEALPYARAALKGLAASEGVDPRIRAAMEESLRQIIELGELEQMGPEPPENDPEPDEDRDEGE